MVPSRETMLQALPYRTFERAGKALLQLRRYLAIHRTGENLQAPITPLTTHDPSSKHHRLAKSTSAKPTKKSITHKKNTRKRLKTMKKTHH